MKRIAAVAALACIPAAPVLAAPNYIFAEAWAGDMFSPQGSGPISDNDTDSSANPGDPSSFGASSFVSYSQGPVSLSSESVSSLSIAGDTISGSASMDKWWSLPSGQSALTSSSTEVAVEFSINEPVVFDIDINHATNGPTLAGMSVTITDTTTNSFLYTYGSTNPIPAQFSGSGTLAPGSYEIKQRILHAGEMFGQGTRTKSMDFQFVIPAPQTTGVLALAGLGAIRRRR